MATITVPKKELQDFIKRQSVIEQKLDMLKRIMEDEIGEAYIRPSALRRWERISRDLDSGKGRIFHSVNQMRQWLKDL